MGGGVGRVVELAVAHTGAGAHALHVTGQDLRAIAHAVPVGEGTGQHIADDFHVPVPVGTETAARRDPVLVDDPQIAPAHMGRIVVASEGETVTALQPAMIGMAPITGSTQGKHGLTSCNEAQCSVAPCPDDPPVLSASFK